MEATEKWCPGAESNHRHCDFQSHALPTELPGRCPERCPGRAPVYSEARPCCPAIGRFSRLTRRNTPFVQKPAGFNGFRPGQNSRERPISARPYRLRRRSPAPEWHRPPRASGLGQHPGSVPSRTALIVRPTACRRSGRVSRPARVSRCQPAFSQPKRIGKPSPPISAVVS